MASVAQQSIGEDAFVEQFQARVKKNPDNVDLKRDLLSVLQMYNRMDEALKTAQQVLAVAPDDVDLLQQTALFYSNEQQLDKAIPLLETLVKSQPKYRLQAAQGLVPLYFKNKEEDKALAVVNQMLAENANDVQTCYVMGSMLQQNGKFDEARKVFEKVKEIDPTQRAGVQLSLANLAKQAGKQGEALALYREALLAEPAGQRGFNYRPRANIYSPSGGPSQNRGYYGNPMMNLPQNVFRQADAINPPASLRWYRRWRVVEILILRLKKTVVNLVKFVSENLLWGFIAVRRRISSKQYSILILVEKLSRHSRLPAESAISASSGSFANGGSRSTSPMAMRRMSLSMISSRSSTT